MTKIPPTKKGKLEVIQGKVTELKKKEKKSYDGGGGIDADCILIEKALNGYILKLLAPSPEENSMVEAMFVFNDRDELIEMLNKHI